MRKIPYFLLLCLCALPFIAFAQDGDNLLVNPGFEQPFIDVLPDDDLQQEVAEGWTLWAIDENTLAPEYAPASGVRPERIESDEDAQTLIAFFVAPVGGVYQTVSGVPSGAPLRFTVNAYVWSTQNDTDPDLSLEPGGVTVEVGIDPTGGTDPESPDIVWGDALEVYDAYTELEVTAAAVGDTVTVFTRVVVETAVQLTEVYFDDAALVVVDGEVIATIQATAEMTEPPTESATEEPTEAPTEVVIIETATEEDAGIIVTVVPILTEEVTVAPTEEDFGIITTPTPEASPTEDTTYLTATAIIFEATQQAFNITETAIAQIGISAQETQAALAATATSNAIAIMALTQAQEGTNNAPTQTPEPSPTLPPTLTPTQFVVQATATDILAPAPTAEGQGGDGEAAVVVPISEDFPGTVLHTVQPRDTVAELAVLYDSTTEAIITANGLDENALIFVGQGLVIPVRIPPPATETPSPTPVVIVVTATPGMSAEPAPVPGSATTYLVQPGDTLSIIARRYNTTVRALAQLNGIVNVNSIQAGQRILIPSAVPAPAPEVTSTPEPEPAEPITYVVRPGDTLYTIAIRYGVTVQRLVEVNNLGNANLIYVGQVLQIP